MTLRPFRWLASGFGSGYAPVASGTFGTLAAMPFAWLLSRLSPPLWAVAVVLSIPLAIYVCGKAAGDEPDPGWVVLDEFVGFFAATLWLPPEPLPWVAAFFLFRLFDILKPPPAGWCDRSLDGGLGIVLDDVAAGVYTRLALWLLMGR